VRDLSAWAELVERVALVVAGDYPDVTASEVSNYLLAVVERTPELDGDDGRTAGVLLLLAEEYATARRAEDLYRSVQYNYKRTDVTQILATVFERSDWIRGHVPEDARSLRRAMDAVDVHTDVLEALTGLHVINRYRLWRWYGLGDEDFPEEAEWALNNLMRVLNDYRRRK